jgi:hypothetical protein
MPVTIELQPNNRIAVVTWDNPVVMNDFLNVFATLEPVYQAATLPVHSIYLADKLTNLPPRAISTYLHHPFSPLVHPMAGIMVVVSSKMFIRMITDTAARLRPAGKLLTATTVEEALAKVEAAMQLERNS